jgi:hypothetical protein
LPDFPPTHPPKNPGIKNAQEALFLGGNFNKLYVSSLDGHLRVFQGETF